MQKELLSAYMDGEQVNAEFTETLCQSEELRQSWETFHLIRSVIKKEHQVLLDADFTAKMANLIEAEEEIEKTEILVSQPTPMEVEKPPFMQKLKTWLMPVSQVAIAAGVCLVVVIGVQSYNAKMDSLDNSEVSVLQTLPFNNSVQEVSYNTTTQEPVISKQEIEQKNRRIGIMLQNYELQRRMFSDSNLAEPQH